ncbi:MAG TPA: thiamine pyrophosphate-binding protein, partial [Thermoanaerobaculia bacterium]|nr:thiamine pyrophosphate-binding protein [Thermoanaerobaculia bacterium]
AREDVRLFSFVDERAAAFFAIGRAKLLGAPVAVVTTSGTAVAELLPATIEAFYSGIGLILISADRPARFRITGAPQSINQEGIFGVYAETSLETWSRTRPLHLNIEFDEPLLDTACHPERERGTWAGGARGMGLAPRPPRSLTHVRDDRSLVIVGGLSPRHHQRVANFLRTLNAPTYAEPLSGLREDPTLPLITAGERMIAHAQFDSVIRIGNVPTLRFWRDLETRDLPITHFTDLPFAGCTRGDIHPIDELPSMEGRRDEHFFAKDHEYAARFAKILDDEPQSELAMFRALSNTLATNTRVYLGNSLPIREWDLAATREPRGFVYEANRGANGIDGQLSTFLGWCEPARDNVCIVGDLTAIYDLNAPWIVPQLGDVRFRIMIVNNGGGRIFSRVAGLRSVDPAVRERIIENVHDVRFAHWAAMWNIDMTELRPDEAASQRAWQKYDELWSLP